MTSSLPAPHTYSSLDNLRGYEQLSKDELLATVANLLKDQQHLEQKRHKDEQLARFANLMRWQEGQTLTTWAEALLQELVPELQGLNAALYIWEEGQQHYLHYAGGYATPADVTQKILPGEGLLGQVASSRKARTLVTAEANQFRSFTSLAELSPHAVLILPLLHDDHLTGVLQLSLAHAPTEGQQELLQALTQVLAAHLISIRSQLRIQALYEEAQSKSEMLAAQEEEMRQNLEELEATQDEMKRVQTELLQSEGRFRRIAGSINGMLFQYMLEVNTGRHGFVYVSEQSEKLLGITPTVLTAGLTNTPAMDLHPEDRPAFEKEFSKSAATIQPFAWLGRIRNAAGNYRWIQAEAMPYPAPGGNILWDGFMSDVTALKESGLEIAVKNQELTSREEELRQNLEELQATQDEMGRQHALLEAMMESNNGPVFVFDHHYRLQLFNEFFASNYRKQGKEVSRGVVIESLIKPELWVKLKAWYDRTLAGEHFQLESPINYGDKTLYYQLNYHPVYNLEGQVVAGAVLGLDITELKALQVRLEESDERLHYISANAPAVVYQFAIDTRGGGSRFTYVSDRLQPLLGYTPQEWYNLPDDDFFKLVHPDERKLVRKSYMQAVSQDKAMHLAMRLQHKDGDYLPVVMLSNPRLTEEGVLMHEGVMLDQSWVQQPLTSGIAALGTA